MKYLVTGSSGHLGEALVRTLRQQNQQVIGIDILPSPFTDRIGSIANRDFVKDCMQGITVVLHAATLHKPHIKTHTRQDFIDTNTTGTLNLLEEAALAKVQSFIFTSTTSTFGDAMAPGPGDPAVWVTEALTPVPKNIYGVTKTAAEDLCKLFYRNHGLPCLVLRTSRFFLELDDDPTMRNHFTDANIKVNEFLYRRGDIEDIVDAHLLAVNKAPEIGFDRYIITATTPFTQADLPKLRTEAPAVLASKYPTYQRVYADRDWGMFPGINRVYVNDKARAELGWKPKYDFERILECLAKGEDYRSPLAQSIGVKGYHDQNFKDGLYPV
ncbi:MAG: NAD(P)-dependent oxidoreductase [Saprospiraceae bacterium]|nr:NAD(P)-dependent oxidoreductase [Saprospiraceae bacterium]